MALNARKLISIEIQTPTRVYSRSIVSACDPKQDDLEYYYKTFCGLADAVIKFHALDIPEEFNASLLATIDRAPTKFPAHDLETDLSELEKRRQYDNFIRQLCEMEQSRAALRVFTRPEEASAPVKGGFTNTSMIRMIRTSSLSHRKKIHLFQSDGFSHRLSSVSVRNAEVEL
jgi:hypothetical protein